MAPNISSNTSDPSIMESKVVYTLSALKNKKGEENIHAEVLKLVNTRKLY